MEHREDQSQIARDRSLLGKHLLDRLLDPVIPDVDLVIERDDLVAELRVLRLERVDGAPHRAEHERALLLQVCLQRVELRLELDARHQPNLPVT